MVLEARQLDEARASRATRSRPPRAAPSRAARAAARCSSPPCASRRARRPGRRSRSRGRSRACAARLAVDRRPRPTWARSRSPIIAQQRRLAAARRADQRDELARAERRGRCPASAVTSPRGTVFVTPRIETTGLRRSRAPAPARDGRRAARRARRRGRTRSRARPRRCSSPTGSRAERVVLVEVEDRAAEAVLDRRGQLADDRADDAGGGGDLEARAKRYGSDAGTRSFQSITHFDAA